ncbi:two pore domain potassium channel family protein [Luteimonas sp. MC1825]|uniref:two pore domain potassium channel family protein n=1 Tax=Luteimonas sp. MC1825 TaxID=2761107 RepID=UPI001619C72F|nr:two pore domain potassium channel family protein [Luteimonas sp. MC1825]MBB6600134.1 two pore domain potassium channel family protein [Luteimonas sp. MC1825]QOC87827.1 two pore domain potassium channel family protein [Luteimonas sp. MC1825]
MPRPSLAGSRWPALASRHPSALLLAAQLLSLLVYPAIDGTRDGRLAFGALALVVVPLAVWVVRRSHSANWIAWLLAIPAIAMSALAIALQQPGFATASAVLESLLYFYAAGSLIHYMLEDHEVSADELFAAAATFTLLAWAFAYAYIVCQALFPGSFTGMVEPDRPRRWIELLHLSFSTLSGVGNGDVQAIGAPARALSMLEQFAGVGYIAAVVGRVIALTVVRHQRRTR